MFHFCINKLSSIHTTLKYQLITSLTLISVVPFITMQFFVFSFVKDTMEAKITSLVEHTLSTTEQNINLFFQEYTHFINTLATDTELMEMLAILQTANDNYTSNALIQAISNKLLTGTFYRDDILSISIITEDYLHLSHPDAAAHLSFSTYKNIKDTTTQTFGVVGGFTLSGNNYPQEIIYLSRQVVDTHSLRHLGTLVVCINPNALDFLTTTSSDLDYASIFVTTEDFQIISAKNNAEIGAILDLPGIISSNTHFLPSIKNLAGSNWKVISIIEEDFLFRELNYLSSVILIFTGFIAVCLTLAIYLISHHFTKPIGRLNSAMKAVQYGFLDAKIDVISRNEFHEIENNFNYMTTQITQLIQTNNHQFKELVSATEKKKQAEIIALEAQINPHFLFNTLDSINWMAIERDEHEISLMLRNLALILRYSIKNSNHMVAVREEVDWIHQYLYLQKQRFMDVFDYEVSISSEFYDYKIYKLLLQPLIENAILHGFEGYTENGLLHIIFEDTSNAYFTIAIKDNGRGIAVDKLESIKALIADPSSITYGTSIGIANVIHRLFAYYGTTASIDVDSTEHGTCFTLTIPII